VPDPLDGLTPTQREIAAHQGGPLLVVGSAGTGKTRALLAQHAWLATAGGLGHLVMLADQPIDELAPNTAVLPADRTAAVVRRIDDRTLQVRVFVGGVGEDPGTGSAAGPIAVLAHEHLGTNVDVTVHQGDLVGRPCRIGVHAEPGAIRVSGRVAACAEGVFTF
jgi:predicted PhzF superfamily epimerase YddE/YHI9